MRPCNKYKRVRKHRYQKHSRSLTEMFKLAVVALLCAPAFARPHEVEIDPHIIGGTKAKEGEFPFAVSLRDYKLNISFCGGSLLSDKYVVTAAHCVFNKERLRIGTGSINLKSQTVYDVEKIIVHPKFDIFNRGVDDIALLRLKTPVKLGGNIQTINFPVTEDLVGKNGTAIGWGRIDTDGPSSEVLLYLTSSIMSNEDCSKLIKFNISVSEICLSGKVDHGTCFGDSGSPLVYKGADGKKYIAGIVSWGLCSAGGYPDVFTRVSHYAEWLKKTMV